MAIALAERRRRHGRPGRGEQAQAPRVPGRAMSAPEAGGHGEHRARDAGPEGSRPISAAIRGSDNAVRAPVSSTTVARGGTRAWPTPVSARPLRGPPQRRGPDWQQRRVGLSVPRPRPGLVPSRQPGRGRCGGPCVRSHVARLRFAAGTRSGGRKAGGCNHSARRSCCLGARDRPLSHWAGAGEVMLVGATVNSTPFGGFAGRRRNLPRKSMPAAERSRVPPSPREGDEGVDLGPARQKAAPGRAAPFARRAGSVGLANGAFVPC